MKMIAVLFSIFVFALVAPAFAQNQPAQPQSVIRAQLDAFAADDAEKAFGLAAPGIRSIFQTPDAFVKMVAKAYPPVYRHRSVDFGKSSAKGDAIGQDVQIVDQDGVVWNALYTLEKEPDGSWKISGCVLIKSEEKMI